MGAAAAARSLGRELVTAEAVRGGDIARAERAELDDGRVIFVKSYPDPPPGLFAAEARGLGEIRGVPELGVPEVLAVDEGWIALEWIERGRGDGGSWEALGHGLAELHLRGASAFGAAQPGYIGTLPQDNTPAEDWPAFYGERRLIACARIAAARGGLDAAGREDVERLAMRLTELCGPAEPPAQLHGDLWSGNALIDAAGRPWLIDPAAYAGHREVDLAMMRLFGGFPETCFAAYDEVYPRAPGHRERVGLYQLYPLLVHAALFGAGYGARARSVAQDYL